MGLERVNIYFSLALKYSAVTHKPQLEVSLYVNSTRIIQYSSVTDILKIIFPPIFVASGTPRNFVQGWFNKFS
jgi:hypothetical protein